MKYNVQLKVYEGPLDLLYDMISKQKIDIKDISIIDITKQYINYIILILEEPKYKWVAKEIVDLFISNKEYNIIVE